MAQLLRRNAPAYAVGVAALDHLGGGLRALRERRAMSQEQLAEKAELRKATVSDWERGARPRTRELERALDALDADLYDLGAAIRESRGIPVPPPPAREPTLTSWAWQSRRCLTAVAKRWRRRAGSGRYSSTKSTRRSSAVTSYSAVSSRRGRRGVCLRGPSQLGARPRRARSQTGSDGFPTAGEFSLQRWQPLCPFTQPLTRRRRGPIAAAPQGHSA